MTKPLKPVKPVIPPAAMKFLRFLDANAVDFGEPFAFQTYDDLIKRKDPSRARAYIGTLDQHAATLADANMNGCAIHVTINDCGDKPRRAANVVRVRKHFVEIDGTMTQPEILALGEMVELPIAWINESSPGKFHVYWNVAVDVAADLEGFTQRQKKLAKLFNAGRESVDLSRVLRLPGYWHQKGEAFQVRTVYQSPKAPELDGFQFFTALSDVEVDDDPATIRDAEHAEDQAAIDAAIEVFKTYTPSISDTPNGKLGKKGNSTTFDACAIAKDKGVDESTCLELADKYYNVRCDPMWSYEELATIVRNVYEYTGNKQGAKHPEFVEAEMLAEAEQDFAPFMDEDLLSEAKERLRREREAKSKLPPGIGHNSGGLILIDGESLTPRNVDFIWPLRLARGKHTAAAGEGGKGKSQVGYDVAARITKAAKWPDGGNAPLGTVLVLSAEDGREDAIAPRLIAAGANMANVKIIKAAKTENGGERKFNLQADMASLKAVCAELNKRPGKPPVMLIIIDPVSSYMGGALDTHRNSAVRDVLDPLNQLAEDIQCAVLSISHFNKGSSAKAIHRVMESAAFVNAPRAAFGIFDPPDDSEFTGYLFLPLKTNIGKKAPGWRYHIEDVELDVTDARTGLPIKTSRVVWDGPTELTADQVAAKEGERRAPKMDQAKAFLLRILAFGPMLVADVKGKADDEGVSQDTLNRAKRDLDIELINTKDVPPKRMWALPGTTVAGDETDFA